MKYNKTSIFGIAALSFLFIKCANAQPEHPPAEEKATTRQAWVDSVYQSLNEKERIGQLFMVAAYSGGENYNKDQIVKLLKAHQIGGLIFMQGTPEAQVKLTNEFQKSAQVPLLIGMDGEWGLGMRLTGVQNYPRQMLLGATRNPALVEQMGAEIAAQCKRMGVHVDFAPDVDVNNNPANPVINFRSFGQNKYWVSQLGIAYMKGLQDNGIIACAKHFPGHGDVSVDSHKDLPVINKSLEEIDTLELYPFKKLIQAGVKSMMVAHLEVPALDNTPHLPTTLSKKVVTGLLRNQLGFQGLIFTDALNMKGVTKYYPDGETDLLAFLAGNDVLLFSQDVPLAIQKIKKAIRDGKATKEDLENRVKKILAAKYDAGLNDFQPLKEGNVTAGLNKLTNAFWHKAAFESITLAKDEQGLLQKMKMPDAQLAYLDIDACGNTRKAELGKLMRVKFSNVTDVTSNDSLDKFDAVVVAIHDLNLYPGRSGSYGLSSSEIAIIRKLAKRKNVCFVVFGNAYLMKYLCNAGTVLVCYEEQPATESAAIEVLSGSLMPKGILPVIGCPQ